MNLFKDTAKPTRLRVFGVLAISFALIELVLCFTGPFRFVQRPSLLLFPPFTGSLEEAQSAEITAFLEKQIALTKSYSITSHSFMEEYLVRTDPDFDKSMLQPHDYKDARRIARELGLDRFAVSWMYSTGNHFEISVSIRDVQEDAILRSGRFISDSYENMLLGLDKEGNPIDMREDLGVDIPGVGFTGFLVLLLLALQLLLGALALMGREPGVLVEIVWAPALILFVFAYIYALSANMDYVQRYIASNGQLQLAESTAAEQLYAFLRFGPILILNGLYYLWRRIGKTGGAETGWIPRYVTRWSLPWTVVSAALFGFSFPSALRLEGIGILAWISLVPLLLILLSSKPAMAVFYGVVFGTLQALIVNYWHGTYDYVTLHLITIAFVVEYLLFMLALVALIRISGRWGFLIVPAAWVVFDYLRSIGILGYPWGIIGTTQFRFLPLIQIASIGGVWAVDFVVLLGNAAIAWALAAPSFGWSFPRIARRSGSALFPLAAFAAVLALSVGGGSVILFSVRHRLYREPGVERANIVLLQQNTDPRKHEYKENFEKLMELTDRAMREASTPVDLVAWPEGGFKLDIRYWSTEKRKNSYWGKVVQEFLEYQSSLDSWLLTGTQDHVMVLNAEGEQTRKNFNSSVLLDDRGQVNSFYHKINLVPFSEYFPLDKERYAGLYEMFQKYDISNWGVGEKRHVYEHEKMRLATPICFEDVFSDHVRRFVRNDVDVILNMSNDYWSLSPVEGYQHGLLSLFRAVENQRPILRTTSSGYTVYIDATGKIQPGAPEPYTEGYVIASVPLPEKRLTLYTRWGDWFPLTALGAIMIMAGWRLGVWAASVVRLLRQRPFRWSWGRIVRIFYCGLVLKVFRSRSSTREFRSRL